MLPMQVQLHSVCWKYHFVPVDEGGEIAVALSPLLTQCGVGRYHTHVSLFEAINNFVVCSISLDMNSRWVHNFSIPRLGKDNASDLFMELKRAERKELRRLRNRGSVQQDDSCSDIRIGKTFDHFFINEGGVLYLPERDGLTPTF